MEIDIDEYHRFAKVVIVTSALTSIMTSGITLIVQNLVIPVLAPIFPSWAFPIVEIVGATVGLFVINSWNGNEKKEKET